MPILPHVIYWIGIIVALGIYLYLVCLTIDGIWDMELTGAVHAIVWELILRNVLRCFVGIFLLVLFGTILIAIVFTYENPWKSLAWVLMAIPILRALFWVFWYLDEDAELLKIGRDSRAEQQGIHGWARFLAWCFGWGPYEGLMTQEEKRRQRNPAPPSPLGNPVDSK